MNEWVFLAWLKLLGLSCNMQARPDQKMPMTTEEPKITEQSAMVINMTDIGDISDEDDSMESGEDESEETESEFIIFEGELWKD